MPKPKLTHVDATGKARMVDVGQKPVTNREAAAEGFITLQRATLAAIAGGTVPKGRCWASPALPGSWRPSAAGI